MEGQAKIGVLGTGDVGRSLGAGMLKKGHPVMLGSREPQSEKVSYSVVTQAEMLLFDSILFSAL